MTSAPLLIATLEDDERRTGGMCAEIERVFPDAKAVFIDNAPDMIGWLEKNLRSVDLLCLDHDLGPNRRRDGEEFDPGIGRDVADFLATRPPQCPVVIHSTNVIGADGMQFTLEDAEWKVERVHPFGDLEWIRLMWIRQVVAKLQQGPTSGADS